MNNLRTQPDKKFSQRGVTLYLAIIVMVLILGIGLGISTILTSQLKTFRGVGNSLQAFYAADTGIEMMLAVQDCIDDNPGPGGGPSGQRTKRLKCIFNHPIFSTIGVIGRTQIGGACNGNHPNAATRMTCLKNAIQRHEGLGTPKNRIKDDSAGSTAPHYVICRTEGNCSLGTIVAAGGSCSAGANGYCAQSTGDWNKAFRRIDFVVDAFDGL